jgi:hypothetical protein
VAGFAIFKLRFEASPGSHAAFLRLTRVLRLTRNGKSRSQHNCLQSRTLADDPTS